MRSGFCSIVGRPNVGKSTLLNAILGTKVSIVSDKPQTTRTQVRGVLNRDDAQVVFVDTPGIHKPRTLLGERLNDTAVAAVGDVDVAVLVVDATAPLGRGDRFVAARLAGAATLDLSAYFPLSASTGEGVGPLVEEIVGRMPEGPRFYPADAVTDVPEAFWVGELVREQLLAVAREELPHSIACIVTEWEWPRIRVEILVERDSQKGIVIGRNGSVLKAVGTAVREQLPPGAFIELFVKVDKDWQRRPKSLDRLGY